MAWPSTDFEIREKSLRHKLKICYGPCNRFSGCSVQATVFENHEACLIYPSLIQSLDREFVGQTLKTNPGKICVRSFQIIWDLSADFSNTMSSSALSSLQFLVTFPVYIIWKTAFLKLSSFKNSKFNSDLDFENVFAETFQNNAGLINRTKKLVKTLKLVLWMEKLKLKGTKNSSKPWK